MCHICPNYTVVIFSSPHWGPRPQTPLATPMLTPKQYDRWLGCSYRDVE